jgi:hypothetical protein
MSEHKLSKKLVEITQAEFKAYQAHGPGSPLVTEKRWFKCGDKLGIIMLDNIDNDWLFVAMSNTSGTWRGFDLGFSYPTADEALTALMKAWCGIKQMTAEVEEAIDAARRD